jgi:hypothetical protein
MNRKVFVIFITYIWAKTLFGLMFHPFMATKQIARRPVLFPVVFSPLMGLFILFVAGRIATLLIELYGLKREAIAFFLSSTFISILLWQARIIYLLGSLIFTRSPNDKN